MLYSNFFKSIILTIGIFFIVGCGSSTTSPTVVKSDVTVEINATSFDTEEGKTTEEVSMVVGESKETETTIEIPKDTYFTDNETNEVVSAVPTVDVSVVQSGGESSTTISFESDGKKVIPSKPVTTSLVAPAGAKPGDEVEIEVPDGISAGKLTQKLIIVIVNSNGRIDIIIEPKLFKERLVIVIIFIAKTPTLDESTN